MTLSVIEASDYGGSPIEFYKFRYGAQIYYQVSATEEQLGPLGVTYSPRQITCKETNNSSEINKNPIDLIVDKSNEITYIFRTGQPDDVLFLSRYVRHTNDVDSEFLLNWQGRVSNCQFEGDYAKLICEPVSNSAKRLGLRSKYQKLCRHSLYDNRCQASELKENITINVVNPTSISVLGITQADGFYNGGNLVLENNAMRMVVSQVGGVLQITSPFNNISSGMNAQIIAGCDHTRETCLNKFNNFLNYGGFPYIPTKNPFTDGPINQ